MTSTTPATRTTAIAIYCRYYLSISMTFVYRQLLGVSQWFDPVVLTTSLHNLDVFPYEPLVVRPRRFTDKVYGRLRSILTGCYYKTSPSIIAEWGRVLRERNVSLIHAHFGHFALDMLPVARSLGIPLVVTFHGLDCSQMLRDARYVRALDDLFADAHVIAASNDFFLKLLELGANPDRLEVHHIGVPTENFPLAERKPIRDKMIFGDPVTFLQVSNFVEKKGHRYTVDAFARLVPKYENVNLVFAGDGPLRPSIEALCRNKGIENRVSFVGRVVTQEVASLMADADVFLHHSVTASDGDKESTTTVIAEAMSTGLITIGTNHGGIPEMIEDGVDGFLVDERDIAGYTNKMTAALNVDAAMAERASHKIRSQFDLSKQNEKLAKIYEKVLAS